MRPTLRYMAVFFSLANLFFSCSSFEKKLAEYSPDIALKEVRIASLDLAGADLDFTFEIHNKVNLALRLDLVAFQVAADNQVFFRGQSVQGIELKPQGNSIVTIRQRFNYLETYQSLQELSQKESVKIAFDGKFAFKIPGFNRRLEVAASASRQIPVPRLPELQFKSFRLVKSNLPTSGAALATNLKNRLLNNSESSSAVFELEFLVNNPNSFALAIAQIRYHFSAFDIDFLQGEVKGIQIAAQKTTAVVLPFTVSGEQLLSLLPRLKDPGQLKFRLSGQLVLPVAGREVILPYELSR